LVEILARLRLDALYQHRDPLAYPYAHGGDPVATSAAAQFTNEGGGHSGARGTEGVPEGDGAAVHIRLRRVEPELGDAGDRLAGKRLIQLHAIDVGDGEAGALQ
jgi:hypothetical protein